jgi:superfamily II helicase
VAHHEPSTLGTKTCRLCHTLQHVLAFAANHRYADGLESACRECYNEVAKRTASYKKAAEQRRRKIEANKTPWGR